MPYDAQGNYTAQRQFDPVTGNPVGQIVPQQTVTTGTLTAARVGALIAKEYG